MQYQYSYLHRNWETVVYWWLTVVIMTSSNGNFFHITGPLWRESTSHRWIPSPVTWSFDVFFDLHLNKLLSKQSSWWWFEMPLRSLWHHYNVMPSTHFPRLGAVRQQAITWANVDPDLCRHMALLGHNELRQPTGSWKDCQCSSWFHQ